MKLQPAIHLLAASAVFGCGCLGGLPIGGGMGDSGVVNTDAGVASDGALLVPADMAIDAKGDFEKNVQALLIQDCGTCHSQAGGSYPGFLAATPDVYTTFINFPGLVGTTPDTSRILIKDVHVGPSYHASGSYTPNATLTAHAAVISAWIVEFNASGGHGASATDMGTKSNVMPTVPSMTATNTINLGEIDARFLGMSVTYTATLVGTTQIKLSGMTLTGTMASGVHVKSPVFARYDASAPTVAVDIDYDYLGADITAFAGTPTLFNPDLVIFPYKSGQLIGLTFDTVELATGSADMGAAAGSCKDLTAYTTFLNARLTVAQTGMNNKCSSAGCHGAAGGVGGYNLNGAGTPAQDPAVCANVLLNTNSATPNLSNIYKHITDGTGHAGGQLDPSVQAAYLTDLTTFINAQK